MTVILMRGRKTTPRPSIKRKATRVYAIAFDLDSASAERHCGPNWRGTCYAKIASVFADFGFARVQGSVYFGDEKSDAVHCVMAVQEADRRFAWFAQTVRDLRMLRVDEDNDLMPAINNRLRLGDSGEDVA
jgi:virulence-associated protein VapD